MCVFDIKSSEAGNFICQHAVNVGENRHLLRRVRNFDSNLISDLNNHIDTYMLATILDQTQRKQSTIWNVRAHMPSNQGLTGDKEPLP